MFRPPLRAIPVSILNSYMANGESTLSKRVIILVGLVLAVLVCPVVSHSCKNPCHKPSLEQAFAHASLVFYGTVRNKIPNSFTDQLTFDVLRSWKGKPGAHQSLVAAGDTCDPMGDNAEIGDRFLIFAVPSSSFCNPRVKEGLWTGYCTGSLKFQWKVKEADYFPKLEQLSRGK